jgi:hypothetical protein
MHPMRGLVPHIVAGIALVVVLDHFSPLIGVGLNPSDSAITSDVGALMNGAGHSGKGDRLVSPRPENSRMKIGVVEIVVLRDTAIVYRDREGSILFRNDPLTSSTIFVKNVDLPEITVRDIAVRPTPVRVPPRVERPRLPVGCHAAFGPLADPSLRVLSGRCLTSTASVQAFASLW